MKQTKNLKSRITHTLKDKGDGLDFPGPGWQTVGAVANVEGCSLFWIVDNLLYSTLEFPLKGVFEETG